MGYKRISRPKEQIEYHDPMYKRLQELEDKIDDGTLKFMPCKVGDTVYMPWEYDGEDGIAILTVEAIVINENSGVYTNMMSDDLEFSEKYNGGVFVFEEVGKTVFLTKAEAEAKLRELKEKENEQD